MIFIEEILQPKDVNLMLVAKDLDGAIEELLRSLKADLRLTDWNGLHDAVFERSAPALVQDGVGICIAHGRTSSVQELVLAAGRSDAGVIAPDIVEPVKLIFVAGIPSAFNADYLRIVGAIARICKDPNQLHRLLGVKDPMTFIHVLTSSE